MELKNKWVSAKFSTTAAEAISFKANDSNIEYIWSGDKTFWQNRNPILFPVVGKAWGESYLVDDVSYTMGQHGFARYATFECTKATNEEVELVLVSDENTLKQYPYHFQLSVNYQLEGKKLWLRYQIKNTDNKPIHFQIGFHPAFCTPLTNDKSFDDYKIIMEKDENMIIDSGYHLGKEISFVNNDFFAEKSAVFFYGLKSEYVDLTDGENGIRVGIANFKRVGFWHKTKDTPFICVEPQHGHGYAAKDNDDLPEDNTIVLGVGCDYKVAYYWEIL